MFARVSVWNIIYRDPDLTICTQVWLVTTDWLQIWLLLFLILIQAALLDSDPLFSLIYWNLTFWKLVSRQSCIFFIYSAVLGSWDWFSRKPQFESFLAQTVIFGETKWCFGAENSNECLKNYSLFVWLRPTSQELIKN